MEGISRNFYRRLSILVAVGHFGGSEVAIYDLSDPASPQLQTMFDTDLASIGALSLWGNYLLVGENNRSKVALLDISKPPLSAIVSTTPLSSGGGGVTSIALNGDNGLLAVVGGVGASVLDYTNPANPVINPIDNLIPPPPPVSAHHSPRLCLFVSQQREGESHRDRDRRPATARTA